MQELHAGLAAADEERVHLRAQVETLTQLVASRGDGPAVHCSVAADEEVSHGVCRSCDATQRAPVSAADAPARGVLMPHVPGCCAAEAARPGGRQRRAPA